MSFNDWLKGNSRGEQHGDQNIEYYEDTHDEQGNYIGKQAGVPVGRPRLFSPAAAPRPAASQFAVPESNVSQTAAFRPVSETAGAKPGFGNIVVYRPTTPKEVEKVIDFLRKGEPAVVNLNEVEDTASQRILDFLSGAVFALSGNIHRITENIFLLSPSGVEIQSYYEK